LKRGRKRKLGGGGGKENFIELQQVFPRAKGKDVNQQPKKSYKYSFKLGGGEGDKKRRKKGSSYFRTPLKVGEQFKGT